MKCMKILLIIWVFLLTCSCRAQTNINANSKWLGQWEWKKGEMEIPSYQFTLRIKKITKDSIYAQYCAVARSGEKIDCESDEEDNVKGIIHNDKAIVKYYSFFNGKNGIAEITCTNNMLNWKIIRIPTGESYAPKYCSMKKTKEIMITADECISTPTPVELLDKVKKNIKADVKQTVSCYPLSDENIDKYNDTAYYLQQFGENNEAIKLLKLIIDEAPDRVVAYINIADSYWKIGNKGLAKKNYQKYISLMKNQSKDMKRIPQRVYDRIK